MSNFVCWWVIFFLVWVIFFVAFGEKKIISQEKKLSPKTKLSSNRNTIISIIHSQKKNADEEVNFELSRGL